MVRKYCIGGYGFLTLMKCNEISFPLTQLPPTLNNPTLISSGHPMAHHGRGGAFSTNCCDHDTRGIGFSSTAPGQTHANAFITPRD